MKAEQSCHKTKGASGAFQFMGKQCKDISGGLPTFISPWIDGKKAVEDARGTLLLSRMVILIMMNLTLEYFNIKQI